MMEQAPVHLTVYKPKPNARVDVSPLVPAPEDVILEASSDEDSPEVRQWKTKRREHIAAAYLKGHAPYIASARLRGPFGDGWENPWDHTAARISRGTASHPFVIADDSARSDRRAENSSFGSVDYRAGLLPRRSPEVKRKELQAREKLEAAPVRAEKFTKPRDGNGDQQSIGPPRASTVNYYLQRKENSPSARAVERKQQQKQQQPARVPLPDVPLSSSSSVPSSLSSSHPATTHRVSVVMETIVRRLEELQRRLARVDFRTDIGATNLLTEMKRLSSRLDDIRAAGLKQRPNSRVVITPTVTKRAADASEDALPSPQPPPKKQRNLLDQLTDGTLHISRKNEKDGHGHREHYSHSVSAPLLRTKEQKKTVRPVPLSKEPTRNAKLLAPKPSVAQTVSPGPLVDDSEGEAELSDTHLPQPISKSHLRIEQPSLQSRESEASFLTSKSESPSSRPQPKQADIETSIRREQAPEPDLTKAERKMARNSAKTTPLVPVDKTSTKWTGSKDRWSKEAKWLRKHAGSMIPDLSNENVDAGSRRGLRHRKSKVDYISPSSRPGSGSQRYRATKRLRDEIDCEDASSSIGPRKRINQHISRTASEVTTPNTSFVMRAVEIPRMRPTDTYRARHRDTRPVPHPEPAIVQPPSPAVPSSVMVVSGGSSGQAAQKGIEENQVHPEPTDSQVKQAKHRGHAGMPANSIDIGLEPGHSDSPYEKAKAYFQRAIDICNSVSSVGSPISFAAEHPDLPESDVSFHLSAPHNGEGSDFAKEASSRKDSQLRFSERPFDVASFRQAESRRSSQALKKSSKGKMPKKYRSASNLANEQEAQTVSDRVVLPVSTMMLETDKQSLPIESPGSRTSTSENSLRMERMKTQGSSGIHHEPVGTHEEVLPKNPRHGEMRQEGKGKDREVHISGLERMKRSQSPSSTPPAPANGILDTIVSPPKAFCNMLKDLFTSAETTGRNDDDDVDGDSKARVIRERSVTMTRDEFSPETTPIPFLKKETDEQPDFTFFSIDPAENTIGTSDSMDATFGEEDRYRADRNLSFTTTGFTPRSVGRFSRPAIPSSVIANAIAGAGTGTGVGAGPQGTGESMLQDAQRDPAGVILPSQLIDDAVREAGEATTNVVTPSSISGSANAVGRSFGVAPFANMARSSGGRGELPSGNRTGKGGEVNNRSSKAKLRM